jgi:hypothetical protein
MKNILKILFAAIAVLFGVIVFAGCIENPAEPDPINWDAPEIKKISVSSKTVMIDNSIDVSVEAKNASGYQWSADAGTFADPAAASTQWTAPNIESAASFRIKCTVTNTAGSNYATVQVNVIKVWAPEGAAAYWSFDSDFSEIVSGSSAEVVGDVSISSDVFKGSGAVQFGGTFEDISILFYPDLEIDMGSEADFTVMFWAKTENEEGGFMFGKTWEGEYAYHSKGLYHWGNDINIDVWGLWGTGAETDFADGEWHHVAYVKTGLEFRIYKNGEEIVYYEAEEWSEDDNTIVTIGSAFDGPGANWPGNFNGLMDDMIFFQKALSEKDIAEFYNGG